MPGIMEQVAEAKATVESLSTDQVAVELETGAAVLVDLREPTETAKGVIPGAVRAPRGMLEFHADPSTPYHLASLDPARRTILYCASGARSALGVRALQDLGYSDVVHMGAGFKGWAEENRPVALPEGD